MTSVKTYGGPDITIPIQSIPTFEKSSVSNAVISVLIATAKNCEEPGTIETVLNSLLTANGLPIFKMGDVTPPTSFPPTQLTPHPWILSLPLPHRRLANRQLLRQKIFTQLQKQLSSRKNKPKNQQKKIYQNYVVETI